MVYLVSYNALPALVSEALNFLFLFSKITVIVVDVSEKKKLLHFSTFDESTKSP